MTEPAREPRSARQLVAERAERAERAARAHRPTDAALLQFRGVGAHDVYNLTAPFADGAATYLLARVEERHSERSTAQRFASAGADRWEAVDGPTLELQDPFTTVVGSERIVGGVKVETEPDDPDRITGWATVFYRGWPSSARPPWRQGPPGMKDIRLVDLGGRVGVFTRPQGEIGGRGTIGYSSAANLDEVTPGLLVGAPLFRGQFVDGEWGGVNEAHDLGAGEVGVLGHIAHFDDQGHKHYYAMAFVLDTKSGVAGPLRVIATRDDFPLGPAKRPELVDVIFPGGLLRHGDGTATLYAGLSDAGAGRATIPDPFVSCHPTGGTNP